MLSTTPTPPGWYIGRPFLYHERNEWQQYAFDPAERAVVGVRRRERTAIAATEVAVVRQMPRCQREISQGRVPK